MEIDEELFNRVVGALICLSITEQYTGYLAEVYKERKSNYMVNKITAVEKSCSALMKTLNFHLDTTIPEVKALVEFKMDLIYESTTLSYEDQHKVLNFVNELKKGELCTLAH